MTIRNAIFGLLISLTLLAVPLQAVIDSSMTNVACACLVATSSLCLLLYMFWSKALETHPLSTFTLFGFCFTNQLGALLVQTAAWTAVSGSLYDPLYTFGTLALYQAVAQVAHCVCRFFSVQRPSDLKLLRGFLAWLGVYKVPSVETLWFMGCVGLCTVFFSHSEGGVSKVAIGFSFLTWAPFLIPFYQRDLGESYCNARVSGALLIVFAAAVCILGLAFNTRAVMLVGLVTIGLLYLLAGMRSDARLTGRSVFKVGAVAVILLAVSFPASDLASSMVIARQWRGKVSSIEMIKTTLYVWGKPNLIESYRQHGGARLYGAYDEKYVANPLLNRLINTKYVDNALRFSKTLTSEDAKARLRDVSIKFVLASLPTPVLQKLGIAVSKDDLAFSMGDYLAHLSRGLPLGGHAIGSMFAQGTVLFGALFPFIYAAMCLVIFWLIDLLTIRRTVGASSLATLGMLQIWTFFLSGIAHEGLHGPPLFIFRNFLQTVLIYAFVFRFAQLLIGKRRSPVAASSVPAWQRG